MAKSISTNYARQKSHWGGVPGTIQMHTVYGMGFNNDPSTAVFRDNIPGGFLRCDGSILNVKDYLLLSKILGVGTECRFAKENAVLRDPDADTGDLGTFQIPDLGSKVIIGGRGSGEYRDTTMENKPNQNKVGVEVTPQTPLGERLFVNYVSNTGDGMKLTAQTSIPFRGNIKYTMDSYVSPEILSIEQYQAHQHEADSHVLNTTASQYRIDGDGLTGDSDTAYSANVEAENILDETQPNVQRGSASHDHRISKPFTYSQNFSYSFPAANIPLDDMESYIDVDTTNLEVLNQVVTPFIMVHYIIKF